ncbi:MAG: BspA family leucine-rich repeat surface protein [Bacilli bacterium]|nr:BspA family leucine-rich repeat surface protein [Bacilli bacterium]
MKKLLSFILLLFIPFIVYAEGDIHIESIELVNNAKSYLENTPAKVVDDKIILDLGLRNVGDNLQYKIVIDNDTETNYEFGEIDSDSEYIEYIFTFDEDNNIISANSSKTVFLNVLYLEEIPDDELDNGFYNADNVIKANFIEEKKNNSVIEPLIGVEELINTDTVKEIVNPNTTSGKIVIGIVLLIISLIIIIILRKHKVAKYMILIIGICIMPMLVYAINKFELKIESHIQIRKIAEFDEGPIVNAKFRKLSLYGMANLVRSDTLPDEVKALGDEQLEILKNGVTDEVANSKFSSTITKTLRSIHGPNQNSNSYYYTHSSGGTPVSKGDLISSLVYLGFYKYKPDGTNQIKYIVYDEDETDIYKIVEEDECKERFKDWLARVELTPNIISSPDSDELIYAWYDSSSYIVYYYTETDDIYLNSDSSVLFDDFTRLSSSLSLEGINTSYVGDAKFMFGSSFSDSIDLDLSYLDFSKVEDMSGMFYRAGLDSGESVKISGLDSWDTSNVTDMSGMFQGVGNRASSVIIEGLSGWNTAKVTNMEFMFESSGYVATEWNVGDLSEWDTANVTNMRNMFNITGTKTPNWSVGDLSEWDVSNVTNMRNMFAGSGNNSTTWSVGSLAGWRPEKVTDMNRMFGAAGQYATTWEPLDVSEWETGNVTDMYGVFDDACSNASSCSIGDLSQWDVSNVTNMKYMFANFGYKANEFNLGNLKNWETGNVTDMSSMFASAGYSATFWSIGDIGDWDISNVTDLESMFNFAGYNASTFNIGNLKDWDTSQVTNMKYMFYKAGNKASTWYVGDLSNWDVSEVTNTYYMFKEAGYNSTTWNIGKLNWNLAKATDISYMFYNAGKNSTTLTDFGTINIYPENMSYLLYGCKNVKIVVNIYNNPSNYYQAFGGNINSQITVNYTNDVTSIDSIVATGSGRVTKGNLIN